MKSTHQASIWKNKIEWFNDGTVQEIEVLLRDKKVHNIYDTHKVIAVCKNGLALHLQFANAYSNDIFNDDYFTVTHIESKMTAVNLAKNGYNNVYNFDYDLLVSSANECWAKYTPEMKQDLLKWAA